MQKGQKASKDGIQYFLCLFTAMYITQGAGGNYSHKGTMANDVRGIEPGVRYPYYAPCDVKLIWRDLNTGEGMWQSLNKVRFANGNVDYATFVTVHDNSFNANVGQIVRQGEQLGNMGDKGNATGVHCHIEIAQHKYTISNWQKNQYGIWCFPNETDTDDCYFVDDTELLGGVVSGDWKTIPKKEYKDIKYRLWIQDIKWTNWAGDGEWCGTDHQSKRAEALQIDPMGKKIKVKAHIQDKGWVDYGYITKDTIIGTQSQQKRIEALIIEVEGKDKYSFQLHIQDYGDSCPTRCDGICSLGSVGQSLRVEKFRMWKN